MGTGVMIEASIFASTGNIAQLAGSMFALPFSADDLVTVSTTNFIKSSKNLSSSGDIVMIIHKAYGLGAMFRDGSTIDIYARLNWRR